MEAVELYLSKLSENGMVAIHISNRHLNLLPVIAGIVRELDLAGYSNSDAPADPIGKAASIWTLVGRSREALGTIPYRVEWRPLIANPKMRVWTDDFSSLLGVLHL